MDDKSYNGWTNYETWNVALWLGNEERSDSYWASEAEKCFRDADGEDREAEAVGNLAEQLKSECEDSAPDLGASMFSDLLSAALSEVNWHEIAGHYVADNMDAVLAEEKAEADELDASPEAT